MAVTLDESVLSRYERFSLYNSPYAAHDEGCAVDLYPGTLRDGRTTDAPSPVSGTIRETRAVRAPPKPYAPEHDHLILIECDAPAAVNGLIARVLHVEPSVEPGDEVAPGDSLGRLVRAGFFAPWVDNHLHVGFRDPDRNLHRATGSLPLSIDADVRGLDWDGTGTVVETGETYAVLDAPAHPNPGREFVGIHAGGGEPSGARRSSSEPCSEGGERERSERDPHRNAKRSEGGEPSGARRSSSDRKSDGGVLDGGLPHYDAGGLLGGPDGAVRLNGDRVGVADGRTVAWDDVVVRANGETITGLSFFCARDADFGAKLICPEREFEVGETVRVRVERR